MARTAATWVASGMLGAATLLAATQDRTKPVPTFQAGTDVIQLDVSVLDNKRHPVTGLTAADFTILEEGKPRPIVAFVPVDVPAPAAPTARWLTDVPRDIATNQQESKRLVVIVIDDMHIEEGNLWALQKTRDVARDVVNDLGPQDEAAVVYTLDGHTGQNFTTDHQRLLAAIETSPLLSGRVGPTPIQRDLCPCEVCSIDALTRVAKALRPIQQQHKSVIYISKGVNLAAAILPGGRPDTNLCEIHQTSAMNAAFREAQLSNVTIHPLDPGGLGGPSGMMPRLQYLRTVAEATGSRAVVDDNDPDRQVAAILEESRSYYLLGFTPTPGTAPDKFRHVDVRVNRRDVNVRTRSGFYSPAAPVAVVAPGRAVSVPSLEDVTKDVLSRADVPMQASVTPFVGEGGHPALAIVVDISTAARAASVQPARTDALGTEQVSIIARLGDYAAESVGTQRATLNLVNRPNGTGDGLYELMFRMPSANGRYELRPGRYELRLGAETSDAQIGTVYAYAEVPDFAREPLSLSGLVLSATPSPPVAPKDALTGLLPVLPTARRAFKQTDRVTAFLRIYQGGSAALQRTTITTQIVDTENTTIVTETKPVETSAFSAERSFDDTYELPQHLVPGEYLLTIDVAAGAKTARRVLRFHVL